MWWQARSIAFLARNYCFFSCQRIAFVAKFPIFKGARLLDGCYGNCEELHTKRIKISVHWVCLSLMLALRNA